MPKVSFVILTYNSQKFIGILLQSIFSFYMKDIEDKKAEVVIVDNDSIDLTISEIAKYGKGRVKVVKSKENLGFAKGINLGSDAATGEYIVILNPDTKMESGNIFETIKLFEKDRKIGVIGGRVLTRDGVWERSAGKFLKTFEVLLMSLGLDELFGIRSSPKKFCQVDFVSGGFMVVRRELFKKFSGFDENFFMYVEDMEFCFRVKRKGYKVYFSPNVVIIHAGHGSSSRSFAIKNIYKGLVYFHKKHGSSLSYFMVKTMLMLKASALVMLGRIINSKYLKESYS